MQGRRQTSKSTREISADEPQSVARVPGCAPPPPGLGEASGADSMFRFLFRFLGLWMLAGAFVSLVIDGTRSIIAGRLVILPLIDVLATLHPASAEWLTAAGEDLSPWLQVALGFVLNAPLWIVLGVLGVFFVFIGRRRSRPIGYSSRD